MYDTASKLKFSARAAALLLVFGAFVFASCARYERVVVVEKSETAEKIDDHDDHEEHQKREKHHAGAIDYDKNFRTGLMFYKRGEFKKAIKKFQKSINKYPKNWKPYHYLGLSLRGRKAYRRSTNQFDQALKRAPRDGRVKSRICFELALTWEQYGFAGRAAANYVRALEFDSSNHKAKAGLRRASNKHKKKQRADEG
ncbi:MAG: tetratricopeptide repeat protein [Candidatus Zixiibacteriota bacterium]